MRRLTDKKGFTLVELAIVLVIIGIILGAVLKGQDLINNAKAKRALSDTQGLAALAYTFFDRYGRFPGDCDSDGDINYATLNSTPAAFGAAAAPAFCYPPALGTAAADQQWNELIQAQLQPSAAPRDLAKNLYNGARYVASNGVYNVVVMTDIPCYAAKIIDTNIDGTLNAGLGYVREITGAAAIRNGTDLWTACTSEQVLVDVAYYFDKRPN
jgi:prepilin-type N-terminal cleavage/methylation domain-containing protein